MAVVYEVHKIHKVIVWCEFSWFSWASGALYCTSADPKRYCEILFEKYAESPRVTLLRNASHLGFAMGVKLGLESCKTQFALICQHDRAFRLPFDNMGDLLRSMRANETIRYIGFPR
jgi:hypothetical protein